MLAALALLSLAASPLERAEAALERGEFEQALQLLEPLVVTVPDGPQRAQVHLLRGRCFAALRQAAQVETAFTLALMSDPEARLDARKAPPDLVETLRALAVRLSGRLAVALSGAVTGDVVAIDGEPVAGPQTSRSVAIGRHTVRVSRGERVVFTAEALVRPGQETRVSGTLPPPEAPTATAAPVETPGPGPLSVVARVRADVLRGVTVDAGAELTWSLLRVGVTASKGAFFGAGLRPGVVLALGARVGVGVFAECDVYASAPVAVSVGGGGALDFRLVGGLEAFAEVSGMYAVTAPEGVRRAYLLVGAGARWRF